MSAISNATSGQQSYIQSVQTPTADQNAGKSGGTKSGGGAPSTGGASASTSSTTTDESASTLNSDGTYGPQHAVLPPANPLAPPTQAASGTGNSVDVKA